MEELIELSQEDLLKMQENMALALTKKCELDMKCSICLERTKGETFLKQARGGLTWATDCMADRLITRGGRRGGCLLQTTCACHADTGKRKGVARGAPFGTTFACRSGLAVIMS